MQAVPHHSFLLYISVGQAPEDVEVGNTSTTEIPVTWKDPNGNTTIFQLNCTCSVDNCNKDYQEFEDTTGTCTGLTPGTTYEVSVSAVVNEIEYAAKPETGLTSKYELKSPCIHNL